MLALFDRAQENLGTFSLEDIEQAASIFLPIDLVKQDLKNYIFDGATIFPKSHFNESYSLTWIEDIGFNLLQSISKQKIEGVKEGSRAFEAGLKNGQKYINYQIRKRPLLLIFWIMKQPKGNHLLKRNGSNHTTVYIASGPIRGGNIKNLVASFLLLSCVIIHQNFSYKTDRCWIRLSEIEWLQTVNPSLRFSVGSSPTACTLGEDALIKHPDFTLPGRKALLKSDMKYEIVLVDASETLIERPKKR